MYALLRQPKFRQCLFWAIWGTGVAQKQRVIRRLKVLNAL
jgi:hypothetical protein